MKTKTLVCPNCSGTTYREALATATSRNVDYDDVPPPPRGSGLSTEKRREVVKLLCVHCGHELSRNGCRA
jgi:hypothetical protein